MAFVEGVSDELTFVSVLLGGLATYLLWKFLSGFFEATPSRSAGPTPSRNESRRFERSERQQNAETTPERRDEPPAPQPEQESSEDTIRIKVRHHENEKFVHIRPNQTIEQIKRLAYPNEIAEGKRVRLVYQGHLLRNENQTASFYNLTTPDLVVIAAITDEATDAPERVVEEQEWEFDLSHLFIPLLAILDVICWAVALSQPNLFSSTAYVLLSLLSALLGFLVYNSYRARGTQQQTT